MDNEASRNIENYGSNQFFFCVDNDAHHPNGKEHHPALDIFL